MIWSIAPRRAKRGRAIELTAMRLFAVGSSTAFRGDIRVSATIAIDREAQPRLQLAHAIVVAAGDDRPLKLSSQEIETASSPAGRDRR